MPSLLRKVKKSSWYQEHEELPWLQLGEVPADSLADLRTDGNALSLWLIEDEANIDRVLAAISTQSIHISNADYRLLDLQVVADRGFKLNENPGETADSSANLWHRDLVELSAGKLVEFAQVLQNLPNATYRRTETQIRRLILDGIRAGNIDPAQVVIAAEDRLWQMIAGL